MEVQLDASADVVLPHSGASARNYASFFGLFDVPQFTSPDRKMAHDLEDWHIYTSYALIALVAVHILAALYHHFVKRDLRKVRRAGDLHRLSRSPRARAFGMGQDQGHQGFVLHLHLAIH